MLMVFLFTYSAMRHFFSQYMSFFSVCSFLSHAHESFTFLSRGDPKAFLRSSFWFDSVNLPFSDCSQSES